MQYSQDSRMMVSPWPTRCPAFNRGRVPPIITVGSSWAAMKMWVQMEVVVVLPWVPEMHRAFLYPVMMAPQAWARSNTGMPADRAAAISGLSLCTAAVRTTQSAPSTLSGRWPMVTGMPKLRRWATVALSCRSEPVMMTPLPSSTSASEAMETPPMPTRWARFPGLIYSWMLLTDICTPHIIKLS